MKTTTVGIDLAKTVFQIHGVDDDGKLVLRKRLDRSKMLEFFVKLPPCLIGMEACGSAHYWARKLTAMGHTVKLMAPQFVKPYVKTNKNDVADAEAICEAVMRPNMRFVPIKTDEQQAVLSLHRVRQSFLKVRTAQANQIRGLLAEFGVTIPQGIAHIARRLPEIMEKTDLPGSFRALLPGYMAATLPYAHHRFNVWQTEGVHICRVSGCKAKWYWVSPVTSYARRSCPANA
jgi:transposase